MRMHAKKRIEIVIEAPVMDLVTDLLDELQVTGYTVLPVIGGRGRTGAWRRDGMVGEAGQAVMIVCVTRAEKVEDVLDPLYELISRQIGIITVSDCEVVRSDYF